MRLVPVRLARPDLKIFVPSSDTFVADGRVVDAEAPYWLGLLADGDLVEMSDDEALDLATAPDEPSAVTAPVSIEAPSTALAAAIEE